MAEYKGAAKEGARAMALMKKREKMKADIEAAKNKISEVCFSLCELGYFVVNFGIDDSLFLIKICTLCTLLDFVSCRITRLRILATSFHLTMM